MKMKKKLALVLAVVMMISLLTACGGKGTSLKDIQKAGKLVIATSPDFPPFESLGADGSVEAVSRLHREGDSGCGAGHRADGL